MRLCLSAKIFNKRSVFFGTGGIQNCNPSYESTNDPEKSCLGPDPPKSLVRVPSPAQSNCFALTPNTAMLAGPIN